MALSVLPRQTQQKKNGILGTLGTLASLAGGLTGQPWLTTLGMGMSGVDSVLNGGSTVAGSAQTAEKTGSDWAKILENVKEGFKNPASGNVAKSPEEQAREEIAKRFGKTAQPIATAANSVGASPIQWPSLYEGNLLDYWRY